MNLIVTSVLTSHETHRPSLVNMKVELLTKDLDGVKQKSKMTLLQSCKWIHKHYSNNRMGYKQYP